MWSNNTAKSFKPLLSNLALVYTSSPGRAEPNKINKFDTEMAMARRMYKSDFIIKFGKYLCNFMFAVPSLNLIVFGSARPGHDV